jgi:hypothetical protein
MRLFCRRSRIGQAAVDIGEFAMRKRFVPRFEKNRLYLPVQTAARAGRLS